MRLALHVLVVTSFALSGAALAAGDAPRLKPLSTSEVDPSVIEGPGCYFREGGNILLVGRKGNAVLNLNNDLLLLRRAGSRDGDVAVGAGYRGSGISVDIAVDPAAGGEIRQGGRIDRPAEITVRRSKQSLTLKARWNCKA